MTDAGWRRLDAAMGMTSIVLITAALMLPGQPPRTSDAAERLGQSLVADRGAFLASQYLAGLAAFAFIWFAPRLRSHLGGEDEGAGRLATASAVGMLLGLTLVLAGMTLFSGMALKAAGEADAVVVRAAVDIGNELIGSSKFAFAATLFTGSLAGAKSGSISQWLALFGLLGGPLLALSAASVFAESAFFEFGGPVDLLGGALPPAWLFVLSVQIYRRAGARESGRLGTRHSTGPQARSA